MEKVREQEQTIEVFENDIQLYLSMFCEENGIEDMTKEPQSRWNSCLRYIYKYVFKSNNNLLRQTDNIYNINNPIPSNYNSYNYDMVLKVLDIYIFDMCMRYDKEVSIIGFSTLTGIDESIIYDWGNGESGKLSASSAKIYKKLKEFREESLSNKLVTGNKNPVGILGVLNRHYQWNLPGVSREQAGKKMLTDAELPKLNAKSYAAIESKPQNVAQIKDNDAIYSDS